jgi:hypothetical protein
MNIHGELTGKAEGFKKVKEPKFRKFASSETEGNSFLTLSTKDSSPIVSNDQNRESHVHERSRSDSFQASSPCWKNLVFPSLPKDGEDGSTDLLDDFVLGESAWESRYSQSSRHPLWNQMKSKAKETKNMISNDPDFVKKLLRKVVTDKESKFATISYSDSIKNHYGNRVLMV